MAIQDFETLKIEVCIVLPDPDGLIAAAGGEVVLGGVPVDVFDLGLVAFEGGDVFEGVLEDAPDADLGVEAGQREQLVVGREGHGPHRLRVLVVDDVVVPQALLAVQTPHLHLFVARCCHERVALRRPISTQGILPRLRPDLVAVPSIATCLRQPIFLLHFNRTF